MKKSMILVLAILNFFTSCDFPRDPKNSFENAKVNQLLVGVAENPPFTEVDNEKFSGKEVDLIRRFAEKKGLKVRFEKDAESDLVKKLEKYEIHVVIGGFDKKTQWKKKAGTTVTYDGENHVFLIPKGENKLLQHLETFILQDIKK